MSISKIRRIIKDYSEKPEKYRDGETSIDYDYSPPRYYYTLRSLPDVLAEAGFQKLGSGNYSWVFALDEKRVVKVVKQSDAAYNNYADYCKSSEKASVKPKIHYSGKWGNYSVYVLEKLVEDEGKARAVAAVVNMLREMAFGYQRDDTDQEYLIKLVDQKIGKPIMDLLHAIRGHGLIDVHYGNIMFRENGELVITDPIC